MGDGKNQCPKHDQSEGIPIPHRPPPRQPEDTAEKKLLQHRHQNSRGRRTNPNAGPGPTRPTSRPQKGLPQRDQNNQTNSKRPPSSHTPKPSHSFHPTYPSTGIFCPKPQKKRNQGQSDSHLDSSKNSRKRKNPGCHLLHPQHNGISQKCGQKNPQSKKSKDSHNSALHLPILRPIRHLRPTFFPTPGVAPRPPFRLIYPSI